jgi:hypothetical protein
MVYRARRCVRNMWGGAPKRSRSSPQVNRFSFEKKCISSIDGAGGGGVWYRAIPPHCGRVGRRRVFHCKHMEITDYGN